MRRAMLLFAILIVQCLLVRQTLALPEHTTVISSSIAAAFCHGHGGGTNCIFCHRDHCHVISCSGASCTNTVTFRRAGRGAIHPPSAGVKSTGGNAPPNGHRHPVNISGFKPPSGVKTTGGNSGPVIYRTEAHHSGGGHH